MARNGKKLVLVVDDDKDQQHAFARAFSRHQEVELLQAYTPSEAITKLERNIRDIDLVILDEDLGTEQISSPDLAEEILAKGYIGFMISMSLQPKEGRDTRMLHAGCRESVHKKSAVSLALDLFRIKRRYGPEDEA